MQPIALTEALKSMVHERDRFMVDSYFDSVKIRIDRDIDLVTLYVHNKPLTMLLQHFGHLLPRCFEQENICLIKGRRTEWVKKVKDFGVKKEEEKPLMWWDEI